MKVLITSSGKDLESLVSPNFESGPYLHFVETVTMGCETEPIEDNTDLDIVQTAIERGIEVVITGSINDCAQEAFRNAGITLISHCNGTGTKHLKSLIAHEYEEAQFACA